MSSECPMCDYSGRSDHLRRHLSRHAASFKETTPAGWERVDDRNLFLQVTRRALSTGGSFADNIYHCGVCFDCCKVLRYKIQTRKKYVSHVCAERKERADRKGVAPANKKEMSGQEVMEQVWGDCRNSVMGMAKPKAADTTKWALFKSKMADNFNTTSAEMDYTKALPAAVSNIARMMWNLQHSQPLVTEMKTIIVDGSLEEMLRSHPKVGALFAKDEYDDDEETEPEPFCDVLISRLQDSQKFQTQLHRQAAKFAEEKRQLEAEIMRLEQECIKINATSVVPSPAVIATPVSSTSVRAQKPLPAHESIPISAPSGGRELR